jgi:predicted hotdog family 3-hydroxylacyl-ACP dehydratase
MVQLLIRWIGSAGGSARCAEKPKPSARLLGSDEELPARYGVEAAASTNVSYRAVAAYRPGRKAPGAFLRHPVAV